MIAWALAIIVHTRRQGLGGSNLDGVAAGWSVESGARMRRKQPFRLLGFKKDTVAATVRASDIRDEGGRTLRTFRVLNETTIGTNVHK
jgi:hypothetical protein